MTPTRSSQDEDHEIRIRDLRQRFGEPEAWAAECSCGWRGPEHGGRFAGREARPDRVNHRNEAHVENSTTSGLSRETCRKDAHLRRVPVVDEVSAGVRSQMPSAAAVSLGRDRRGLVPRHHACHPARSAP
jgi:hypothetical protein